MCQAIRLLRGSAAEHTRNFRATTNEKIRQSMIASYGLSFLENFALLMGQSVEFKFYNRNSPELLSGIWLIFAFIVSTVYRSNLTASLTYPTYPPRPETLSELVKTGAG